MTNMRKRHVYPVLAGKKQPKSALELAILERHQQGSATPPSRTLQGDDVDADSPSVPARTSQGTLPPSCLSVCLSACNQYGTCPYIAGTLLITSSTPINYIPRYLSAMVVVYK